MLGNLRAMLPSAGLSLHVGQVGQPGCGSPQGIPLAVVPRPGSAVCRRHGDQHGMPAFYAKEELQGVCMGQAVWGKNPGPAQDYSSFSPGICCPTARLLFSHLNVLLHITEGTTGTLERTLAFSRACAVFVLEVEEPPQDRGSSWVAVSMCFQGCFCFSCQNLLRLVDP